MWNNEPGSSGSRPKTSYEVAAERARERRNSNKDKTSVWSKGGVPYGQAGRVKPSPKSPKPAKKTGNTSVNTNRTGSARWENAGTNTRSGDARRERNKDKRTTYDFQDFNRYKGEKTSGGKGSVIRDVQALKKIKGAAERRTFRESKGLYKGNYYGPDVFKGDKGLNKAYEKSGKKGSAAAFAANYRKASNR